MSDWHAARRMGLVVVLAFDVSWRLFVVMRQYWTGNEAYPIADTRESPWVVLLLGIQADRDSNAGAPQGRQPRRPRRPPVPRRASKRFGRRAR